MYILLTKFIPKMSKYSDGKTEKTENDKIKMDIHSKFAEIYFDADIIAMAVTSLISMQDEYE